MSEGIPLTREQQIERFRWMLAQCDQHGWIHLREFVQAQLEIMTGEK